MKNNNQTVATTNNNNQINNTEKEIKTMKNNNQTVATTDRRNSLELSVYSVIYSDVMNTEEFVTPILNKYPSNDGNILSNVPTEELEKMYQRMCEYFNENPDEEEMFLMDCPNFRIEQIKIQQPYQYYRGLVNHLYKND